MSLCDLETDHDEDSPSRSLLTQFLRSGGRTGPELISIYTDIACSQPLDVDDTLHLACERHQLDHALIEGILRDRPAALSTPRDRGWLPIHHAAMANSYDAVAFLLKRFPGGASIEQDDGFLPLHMAVYFEDVDCDVVEMILAAHPAAARHRSRDGRTALHIAMENPNVNYRLARLLLHAYPEAAQLATDTGLLPLHICAENKHCSVEVFSAVLEAFPDAAGERDAPPRHRLPLHYAVITAAASSGSAKTAFVDIVKQLIKYTPLNKPLGDYSGKNPLHLIFQLLALCPYQPVGLKSDGSSSDGEGSEDSRALTVMGETDHSTETSSVDSLPTGACAVSTLELILNLLLVACPALLCERCSAGRLPIVDYIDLGARPSAAVVEAVVRVNSHALMIGDHRGCTPLHILLKKPAFSIDVFEVMLQYCPEASTVPCVADSSLPIHTALRNIHCNSQAASYIAAKRLLEVYPGAADQADSFGFLPLHLLVSRCDPDTSLLRRLLAICPLGVETATFKDAGQLLPIHCAVVAARPSRGVIQLLLDAYPEGLMALCAENLGPLDYMFLNLKCQYSKRNMLRSATPSLRAPLRKELYEPVPPAIPRPLAEPTLFQSVERLPSDLLRDLALIVDMPSALFLQDGLLNVDNGDSMALRNNNVMSYFKGKTDEEILYLTLDLLKNNNYEVTDDMIVLFGSRLSGASSSEIMEDSMMFRGDFSDHQNFDDGCQCVIM